MDERRRRRAEKKVTHEKKERKVEICDGRERSGWLTVRIAIPWDGAGVNSSRMNVWMNLELGWVLVMSCRKSVVRG